MKKTLTRVVPLYTPLCVVNVLVDKLRLLGVVEDVHIERNPGYPMQIIISFKRVPNWDDLIDIGICLGVTLKD